MKKIYLLLIFVALVCFSFTSGIQAQSNDTFKQKTKDVNVEGLLLYPNPVPEGRTLFITSTLGRTKTVKIFSVLGEQILYKVLIGKELDIAHLNTGIYIITVIEGESESTRKLIIQ